MKLKTNKTFITRARTKKIKIKRTRTEVESPITKRTKLYLWKRRERERKAYWQQTVYHYRHTLHQYEKDMEVIPTTQRKDIFYHRRHRTCRLEFADASPAPTTFSIEITFDLCKKIKFPSKKRVITTIKKTCSEKTKKPLNEYFKGKVVILPCFKMKKKSFYVHLNFFEFEDN
jgi:hypothetical protein